MSVQTLRKPVRLRLGPWPAFLLLQLGVLPWARADSLTLPAALARLAVHPVLAGGQAEFDAARARSAAAGLGPAWELATSVDNVGVQSNSRGFATSDGTASGFDVAEVTVALGRVIEAGGKRAARQRLARVDEARSGAAWRLAANELGAEAARSWHAAVAAREARSLAIVAADDGDALVTAADRRVTAGAAPRAEAELARATALRLRLDASSAEAAVMAADATLTAVLASDVPVTPSADRLDTPNPAEDLDAAGASAVDAAPELALATLAVARGDAALVSARLAARPDLRVDAGVRYLGEFNATALVTGFAVPLGTARRAMPLAEAAAAEQRAAESAARATRADFLARERSLELAARAAALRADTLRSAVLPRARAAATALEQGYRAGRFAWNELAAARSVVREQEAARLLATLEYHQAVATLAALRGQYLLPNAPDQAPETP